MPAASAQQLSSLPILLIRSNANRWSDRARATLKFNALEEEGCGAVVEVEAGAQVKYHLQGDAELSASKEVFKERQRLRRHPSIAKILDVWWVAMMRRVRRSRPEANALAREDYCLLYRGLYQELLDPEDFDADEAQMEASAEWETDCKGGERMERTQFLDALFEVVVTLELS